MLKFIIGLVVGYLLAKFFNKPASIKNVAPTKTYNGITGRCWVCGELERIYCYGPHTHTIKQQKNQLEVLKSLGYTDNLPSID
jgi:hypothetical protein